jgi:eukaryotic-like serine/threonine-protein kinase
MEDRRMVQLALMNRYVTPAQIEEATREQQQLADRGVERSVWFLLLDLGFISDAQARDLRKHISSSAIRALEVDGYVLQGRIGSGGMGDVFRARNPAGGEAAVKLLSSKISANPEHARRFQREARAGLRLLHPHITRSLSAGEMEEQRYLIMELIKGPSLKQYIQECGKMSEADGLVLIWQIASALGYAWSHGVLHRDVKPGNLMLAPPRPALQEPFCAKVCDFGLAKVWQRSDDEHESGGQLTATNMALGTPHYMAPEQASGEKDLDQRADLYSLGASVFHALLGKTMHSGKSSTVIMYKQVTEAVDLAPLRAIGISPATIKLLGRMVERNRKHRFPTWGDLQAAVAVIAPEMAARQQAAIDKEQPSHASEAPPPAPAAPAGPPPAIVSAASAVMARAAASSASNQDLARPIIAPAQSWRLWRAAIFSALGILLAAALMLMILGKPAGQHVTPASFAAVLVASQGRPHADLVLEPGDYPGPWCFGAAHSGMTIRAAGPGVRLAAGTRPGDVTPIQLEPGLKDFRLAGIELTGSGEVSVEALSGAQATLQDLIIPSALVVSGADVVARGLTVEGGVRIDGHGHLLIEDSQLHGAGALTLHDGRCELHRCRLGASAAATAVVRVVSGDLELDAVAISGTSSLGQVGETIGLELAPGSRCTIRDVLIEHVGVGLSADAAELTSIDGLSLEASHIGLRWSGLRAQGWSWKRLRVHAPEAVRGELALPADGDGARLDRLALIPPAGADTHH